MRLGVSRAIVALAVVACGSASSTKASPRGGDGFAAPADGGTSTNGPLPSDDASPDSSALPPPPPGFPAAHPSLPQVATLGGPVLPSPRLVPITFPGDALVSPIEDFVSKVGSTAYWADNVKEYGVGPATMGTPVRFPSYPFASDPVDDVQISAWIAEEVASGALPPSAGDTLYVVFLPEGKTVTHQGGTSCTQFTGYHEETKLAGNQPAAYIVIPRCPSVETLTGIQALTATASHELVEATTDPYPDTAPAYLQVDAKDLGWLIALGGAELADMCTRNADAFFQPAGFPYFVQRTWSNQAAAASHDPCAPAQAAVYFNAAPVWPDTVPINYGPQAMTVMIQGVQIPIGQSKTIEIDLFSDNTSEPWSVSAEDNVTPPMLGFSFDQTTGQNGDTIHLTITVLQGSLFNLETFLIKSQKGGIVNSWVGVVGND